MVDLEVPIRGLIKEACKLADSADDADVIPALAITLHVALINGGRYTCESSSCHFPKGGESAWQQIRLYLAELDAVPQRLGPLAAAGWVRAIFFWLYFEHWVAVLLSGKAKHGPGPAGIQVGVCFSSCARSSHPCVESKHLQKPCKSPPQTISPTPLLRYPSCRKVAAETAAAATTSGTTGRHARGVTLVAFAGGAAAAGTGTSSAAQPHQVSPPSHLSLVTPPDPPTSSGAVSRRVGSARVTSRGADLAASCLSQRFAVCGGGDGDAGGGGEGVSELLLYLAAGKLLNHVRLSEQPTRPGAVRAELQQETGQVRWPAQEPADGADSGVADGDGDGDGRDVIDLPEADEAALRHLLLLPPTRCRTPSGASATAPPSRAAAGMYGTLYEPASLAALLVSVPDRAAGLLLAPQAPPPGALPGGSDPALLLQPELFHWRVLRQLLAVLGDPRRGVTRALARLRSRHDEIAAAGPQGFVGGCEGTPSADDSGVNAAGSGAGSDVSGGGGGRSDGGGGGGGRGDGGGGGGGRGDGGGQVSGGVVAALEPLVAAAAVELLAELLERLAKRGHAAAAADALLACTASLQPAYDTSAEEDDGTATGSSGDGGAAGLRLRGGVTAALVQLADGSAAALERLLAALLDRAAAAATALTAAGAVGDVDGEEQLRRQQRREVQLGLSPPLPPAAAAAALAALAWLLPRRLADHPTVSYTLADRLLLAPHRPSSPPPLDRLQLLAAALLAAYPGVQPAAAAAALAAAWGDAAAVPRSPLQRQAYLSQALLYFLAQLSRAEVEGAPGLLAGLLAGVSVRLGSPLVAVQRQAMRVGRAFSLVLDPASDLFADMGDLGLGPEELWLGALPRQVEWRSAPGAATEATAAGGAAASQATGLGEEQDRQRHPRHPPEPTEPHDSGGEVPAAAAAAARDGDGDEGSVCTATDSDDESEGLDDDDGEEEELRPLGSVEEMEGDPEAEAWRRVEPSALQLRALAAALRKQDEANTVLTALKRLEEVIRAAPDELGLVAPELVRSLLHCRVPEWAETEAPEAAAPRGGGASGGGAAAAAAAPPPPSSSSPAAQRRRCLVALLTTAPLPAGDALVPEVYSPHLDLHQRLTLLDALSAAAAELSDPRVAPRLTQGPGGRPLLARPDSNRTSKPCQRELGAAPGGAAGRLGGPMGRDCSDGGADANCGSGSGMGRDGVGRDAGGRRGGGPRTRVWAPAALRKRREAEAAVAAGRPVPGSVTFRNRFADVALRWAAGLLREVDRVKHGVDLLGRDHQLLGRLLATLATFAEAAAGSGALPALADATLELIRSPQVHAHSEPYVRRAALLAAGQVLAQLPPAAVAGALLRGGVSRGGGTAPAPAASGSGGGLPERLEWVAGWCRWASEDDMDLHCRMMAQACVNLQADLASRCLASLQDAASAAAPLAPSLPSLDLARTARLLASSPAPSLPGGGGAGAARWSGSAVGAAAAAAALVHDVSAW